MTTPSYESFELDIAGGIAHLRMSRPDKLNTLNAVLFRELREIVERIDDESAARIIVLSATGKHFCAGIDHSELTDALDSGDADGAPPPPARPSLLMEIRESAAVFDAIERLRIPVLAAIQGGCIGGGFELAAACDLRFTTEDAFFVIQQINLGFPPDLGALQRLPRLMHEGLVRELALTGRRMPAEEARAAGFVNAVHANHDELLAAVNDVAEQIAAKSPTAVWGTKDILRHAREHTIDEGVTYVAAWQAAMLDETEVAEGVAAFREKRPPRYAAIPRRARTTALRAERGGNR